MGQTTLAIGNPFGLDHTLTVGVVSGVGREMTAPSGRQISNPNPNPNPSPNPNPNPNQVGPP